MRCEDPRDRVASGPLWVAEEMSRRVLEARGWVTFSPVAKKPANPKFWVVYRWIGLALGLAILVYGIALGDADLIIAGLILMFVCAAAATPAERRPSDPKLWIAYGWLGILLGLVGLVDGIFGDTRLIFGGLMVVVACVGLIRHWRRVRAFQEDRRPAN